MAIFPRLRRACYNHPPRCDLKKEYRILTSTQDSRPRRWIRRLIGLTFGLLLTWLMLEGLLRVGFDMLSPGTQGAIQNVRMLPWSDDTIAPVPPWISDIDYQNMAPPGLKDRPLYFSDGKFDITTISLFDGRVGFRTNPPQWPVDIAAVGDSFTFCFNAFDDCWVQRLHNEYGWSTMDLGERGTGSLSHLQILKSFVTPLQPKVVIWQWYGNDANEDYGMAVMRGETPPLEVVPPVKPPPDYGWLADYSAVYALLRDVLHHDDSSSPIKTVRVNGQHLRVGDPYNIYANDLSRPANQYGWERMVEALTEANQIAADQLNAPLVIVLMPTKDEIYADEVVSAVGQDYLDTVSEGRLRLDALCAERGWHCLDLTGPLQDEVHAGRKISYDIDHHITAYGNDVVARVVADYLVENGLLARP
jgi:hypothetical protein